MFDISRGQKTLFFKKFPNNGLVSEKKYIIFSVTLGGGSDRIVTFVTIFFFFLMKASLSFDLFRFRVWDLNSTSFSKTTIFKNYFILNRQ